MWPASHCSSSGPAPHCCHPIGPSAQKVLLQRLLSTSVCFLYINGPTCPTFFLSIYCAPTPMLEAKNTVVRFTTILVEFTA